MMLFAEFAQKCSAAGMNLDPTIAEGDLYAASREVARLALDGTLPTMRIDPTLASGNEYAVWLTRVVNSSIDGVPEAAQHAPVFPSGDRVDRIGSCVDAEKYFDEWLNGLENGEAFGGSVIVGQDRQAVGVSKANKGSYRFGEPSTLFLRDIVIKYSDGRRILYPAGTLADARLDDTNKRTHATAGNAAPSVITADQIAGMNVTPIRLLGGVTIPLDDTAQWEEFVGTEIDKKYARSKLMTLDAARRVVKDYVAKAIPQL